MDAETLKALRGSIAKWQAIVDGTGKDLGAENCPLCWKFNKWYVYGTSAGDCDGCPVKERTGENGCRSSPHEEWEDMDEGDASAKERNYVAKAELDFLKSLLPPGVES
jgi:hypothetical protein